MTFTGTAKKVLAFILSLAIVLTGLHVFAPQKAHAAVEPVVKMLGSSIRLSGTDNAGKQSMRVGIVVDNASKAVSCSIRITIESNTYVVTTGQLAEGERGFQKKTLYAKDTAADRVVYVAVVTNMSADKFYTPIEITGTAKGIDGTVYSSGKITRNIMGIVNSMQSSYPTLGITMQNGTLYKNSGQTKLTASDIAGGNYGFNPNTEAGDIPVPTEPPAATPTPTPTPDPYNVELFTVTATENKVETVNGNTVTVDMKFYGGSASGTYFNGNILRDNTSCDVVKTYKSSGNEVHQARYFLDGKDKNGNNCRIFIEDNSISAGNGTVITKPIFITNSSTLAFLEKADVQGRVTTDSQGRKIIKYMWNSSNTTPVPFREVHIPDSTHNYTKELFTINISVGSSDSVNGANGSATMIYFGGSSNCNNLKNATIVASDADTRLQYTGTIQTLSARYILSGKRADGVTPMKVYVENNGIDNNGMVTEPTIITDDPSLAYVESAWTHGTVGWEPGLTIHLWTTP